MSFKAVLFAIWKPETETSDGMEIFCNKVLLVMKRSAVILVKLLAWTCDSVVCWIPIDPVTLANALMDKLATCCMVKFPQLVKTGKETETPAALAEMRREVSTSVSEFIATVLKNRLLVMLMVLARDKLIPLSVSN